MRPRRPRTPPAWERAPGSLGRRGRHRGWRGLRLDAGGEVLHKARRLGLRGEREVRKPLNEEADPSHPLLQVPVRGLEVPLRRPELRLQRREPRPRGVQRPLVRDEHGVALGAGLEVLKEALLEVGLAVALLLLQGLDASFQEAQLVLRLRRLRGCCRLRRCGGRGRRSIVAALPLPGGRNGHQRHIAIVVVIIGGIVNAGCGLCLWLRPRLRRHRLRLLNQRIAVDDLVASVVLPGAVLRELA
mmetsp:Transcript_49099/g.141153  ORF Transcript_49099/g.141153 Transcript_49099/m.141153 type:complete len:244 (-) Transcript_49099:42-773(-)